MRLNFILWHFHVLYYLLCNLIENGHSVLYLFIINAEITVGFGISSDDEKQVE